MKMKEQETNPVIFKPECGVVVVKEIAKGGEQRRAFQASDVETW